MNRTLQIVAAASLVAIVSGASPLDAQGAAPAAAPPAASAPAAAPAVAAATPSPSDDAAAYCRNIANAAADARYARQADALATMNQQLSDKLDALTKKEAEYQSWVTRREDLLKKADDAVVAIYSQMRPDAAAMQIAIMDPEAAAAILSKLSPRTASAILNEMDAGTAARLTSVMAGVTKVAKS
jgi:flagellar motility protein MotE (MotC chaperone)